MGTASTPKKDSKRGHKTEVQDYSQDSLTDFQSENLENQILNCSSFQHI